MIDKLKTWIKKQTLAERERKIQDLKMKDGKTGKMNKIQRQKQKNKTKQKQKKQTNFKQTNWKNKEIKS